MKLYPAVLLPVLWKRKGPRFPLAFLATVFLGYLPYAWAIGWKVTGFLPTYFARFEDFNVGLRAFLTGDIGFTGDPARLVAMGILAVALGLILIAIGRRRAETPAAIARAGGWAVAAYLLLVPATMHPWYVVWLIPFLCALPVAGGWYLSGAVVLSYAGYTVEPHQVPLWARCTEYLPTYALMLLALKASARWPAWVSVPFLRAKTSP